MRRKTSIQIVLAALILSLLMLGGAWAADWPMFLKNTGHDTYLDKAPQPPYNVKWRFKTKGPIRSSPAVSGGTLYIGSYDGSLYAVDAATGKGAWSFKTGEAVLSTPAVYKNAVYFGSKDGFVYALETATGKLIWKYEVGLSVLTSASVTDDLVFIGSMDGYLYAISRTDGTRQWRSQLYDVKYGGVYASPAYQDGSVYYAGKNGYIYSTSAASGGRNWQHGTASAIYASPVIKDGVVYAVSHDRVFYALDAKTGKRLWKKRLNDEMGYASPVVAGEDVYLALQSGHVKVFNKTDGKASAEFSFPGGIKSTPIVSGNGIIIVGSTDGFVYAANSKTGVILWRYKTGGPVHSSPAVVDNVIYIGSEDGTVYAFAP